MLNDPLLAALLVMTGAQVIKPVIGSTLGRSQKTIGPYNGAEVRS